MKLIQTEIDANPASTPATTPSPDGRIQKNASVAALNLVNSAGAENNFWVWVRAARPEDAWLEKVVTLESLDAATGVQDNLENGKYKAYVAQGGTRRLMVKVRTHPQPESKAGVYDMVATVQSQVPLRVGNDEQTLFEFPFRVAVRPYVNWSLGVEPAEVPVRITRRKAMMWATVENLSNDWLYVDLRLPKEAGSLSYERDVERIAVPPAASAKSPSVRRIPIRVRSKYKNIRGTSIKVPVPLQAVRVDAPSVARFPSAVESIVPSLNLSSPVMIDPTTDSKSASGANVAYYPPIPATFTDFITSIRTNLMSLIGLFLMGAAAFYAGSFMYEHAVHRLDQSKIKVDDPVVLADGSVVLHGQYLKGCDISVKSGDRTLPITVDSVDDSEAKFHILPPNPPLPGGTIAKVSLLRRGFGVLSWPPIYPTASVEVTLGKAKAAALTPLELQVDPAVDVGGTLAIEKTGATDFGKETGTVKLGTRTLTILNWKEDHIDAQVPPDPAFAAPGYPLLVSRADGGATGKATITVKDPAATLTGGETGGTVPPTDGGASGGAASAGGGGASGGTPDGGAGGAGGARDAGAGGSPTGGSGGNPQGRRNGGR